MTKLKFALLALLLSFASVAQDRPKVGIVLSGGGAKGFAHIGFLQIVDSLGIPVDMIGGTSMGSIVGGLYTIGHSPDSLESLVSNMDWSFLTDPSPQRRYISTYEKNNDERYVLTLNLTRDGLQIPSGLNPGERIINILSYNTAGYHEQLDYTTDLPIPFVCISTELNTGEEHVMRRGILPLSMRSSMGIPSLFNPYYYENQLMIDGGSVNNFPADHVKDLGADILIGVDVQTAFKDSLSDPSFLKILEKTSMYVNAATTRERENLCDLIINPDMSTFSSSSFGDAAAIVEEGRRAARRHMDELLAIREQIGGPQPRTVPDYEYGQVVKVDAINISGLRHTSPSTVLGNIGFGINDTVDYDQLNDAMLRVHATNQYSLTNYLATEQNGKSHIKINVVEKPSRVLTRVGVRYDSDFETAAMLNITSRNHLFNGSYFSLDAVASRSPRFRALYIWDNGELPGMGVEANYWNYKSDLRVANENLGQFSTSDFTIEAYGMKSWNRVTTLRIGARYHNINVYTDLNSLQDLFAAGTTLENLELFTKLDYDNRDRSNFATNGSVMQFEAMAYRSTLVGTDGVDWCLDINWERNNPIDSRLTLRTGIYGLANYNSNTLTYPYAVNLGGMGRNYINNNIRFYGYHLSNAFIGYWNLESITRVVGAFAFVPHVDLQFEIFDNHFLTLGANGAYLFDDLDQPFNIDGDNVTVLGGYMVEYGLKTMIGPISVSASKSTETNDWVGYLNIGYWF